ncbi:hypothetical protein TrRE_jg5718 [Triparma retinervis]|uniref:Uncharacterized protein n=1 Tax=Triparma retinervis TaxID=2557542 RepID=A0A9W7AE59_9STRA|nr:hypothetical protein TrRE_jg5718 [Triparma retinervis]
MSAQKKATGKMKDPDPIAAALPKSTAKGKLRGKKPLNGKKITFDDSDVSSDEEEETVVETPSKGSAKKRTQGKNKLSPHKQGVSPMSYGRKKQKRRPWSQEEEACIRAGVERYGEGHWAKIRDDYSKILEGRNSVNIKDKWRNMNK